MHVLFGTVPYTQPENFSQEAKVRQQIIGNAVGASLLAIVLLDMLIRIRV